MDTKAYARMAYTGALTAGFRQDDARELAEAYITSTLAETMPERVAEEFAKRTMLTTVQEVEPPYAAEGGASARNTKEAIRGAYRGGIAAGVSARDSADIVRGYLHSLLKDASMSDMLAADIAKRTIGTVLRGIDGPAQAAAPEPIVVEPTLPTAIEVEAVPVDEVLGAAAAWYRPAAKERGRAFMVDRAKTEQVTQLIRRLMKQPDDVDPKQRVGAYLSKLSINGTLGAVGAELFHANITASTLDFAFRSAAAYMVAHAPLIAEDPLFVHEWLSNAAHIVQIVPDLGSAATAQLIRMYLFAVFLCIYAHAFDNTRTIETVEEWAREGLINRAFGDTSAAAVLAVKLLMVTPPFAQPRVAAPEPMLIEACLSDF